MEGSAAAVAAPHNRVSIIVNKTKKSLLGLNFIYGLSRIGRAYDADIIAMKDDEYIPYTTKLKTHMENAESNLCYGVGDEEYKLSIFRTASFLIVVTDVDDESPVGLTAVIVKDHKLPAKRELYISIICSSRFRVGTLQMNIVKDIARFNNFHWIRLESMKEATKFYTNKSGFVAVKGHNTAKNLCHLEFNVAGKHRLLCKLNTGAAGAAPAESSRASSKNNKKNTLKRRRNNNSFPNTRTTKKAVPEY